MRSEGIFILTAALLAVPFGSGLAGCNHAKKNVEPSTVTLYVTKEADVKAGEKIFRQGNSTGAAACLACHGAAGEGQQASAFPRLANQSRMYISEQLHGYKQDLRNNPVMMPIAKALSDQEIEDVAAYIETMAVPPYVKTKKLAGNELTRGRELAEVGDFKANLQSCANCHGPGGIGQEPSIPYLQGQFAPYLEAQLMAWKNGTRKTNADHMGVIAKLMSDQDVKIMASYFEKLPNSPVMSQAPLNKYSK
jgi:cytochrome c553